MVLVLVLFNYNNPDKKDKIKHDKNIQRNY